MSDQLRQQEDFPVYLWQYEGHHRHQSYYIKQNDKAKGEYRVYFS